MFRYDPLIKKRVLLCGLSFDTERIISLFKNIVKTWNRAMPDRFIPSREGESKLVFFFGNEAKLWVFGVPGLHNDWERMGIDRDKKRNKELRYALKTRVDLDKKITVYEDKNGVLIQNYAGESIDFTKEEVKRNVLRQCRRLHQLDEIIEIQNDMIERYFINLTEKVRKSAAGAEKTIQKAEAEMKRLLAVLGTMPYVPRICHCDLFCSNIVSYQGELFFIDWEYMAMCDPMFDVCGFLFSAGLRLHTQNKASYDSALQQIYLGLEKELFVYFERNCTQEEYHHAFLILLLLEYRELLSEALSKGAADVKKAELLLRRMSRRSRK